MWQNDTAVIMKVITAMDQTMRRRVKNVQSGTTAMLVWTRMSSPAYVEIRRDSSATTLQPQVQALSISCQTPPPKIAFI